jgi:tungstate transport system substrate-binding protein
MADQKRAYVFSDRATFLAQREGIELEILFQGDPLLVNRYSVIVVNPEKHAHVRVEAARRFADFLFSPEARQAIAGFGVDRYGQPLYFIDKADRGKP